MKILFILPFFLTIFTGCSSIKEAPLHAVGSTEDLSASYKWVDIVLEASARDVDRVGARPTIISRQMVIPLTAMYDAWSLYDQKATPTLLDPSLRRPAEDRTIENKRIAIAYATFRGLLYVFPDDKKWLYQQMRNMGHDPTEISLDPATAQGIGNKAAKTVITYRRKDGSNQEGLRKGSNGKPYSDYTNYQAVNPPGKIVDPDRWGPLPFIGSNGKTFYPGFLTPHWHLVKPFALKTANQFRPGPPPKVGEPQLQKEVDEIVAFNSGLTLEQKAIVEFMRDGPRSTGQSGHWLRFAQDVSRRDNYGIDEDVKLFFAVANVAFDAFIASWESKRYYDSSRPWHLVRYYYKDKKIWGWQGPGRGVALVNAEDWLPYSPLSFLSPPFPGYVSGHSTVSAASAKILELFTGSDRFGVREVRRAGILTEDGYSCEEIQRREGKPLNKLPKDCTVELELPSFSGTAEMAGISRVMGAYHIQADNIAGLKLGRDVANWSWPVYQSYFNGVRPPDTISP